MERCLVTGGAGFIGSNLVKRLVDLGHEVIVVDNFHSGSKDNLKDVIDKIKLIEDDCENIPNLDIPPLDAIFHLGMYSSSPMYKENKFLVGNVINGSLAILELAKKNNAKVVFAATSSIYNGNPIPWKEDLPVKVTDFYCEARYAVERLARLYYILYGVKSIALRLFSVYGKNEESKGKYANLVSQFLWSIQKDESPLIFGDGTQTRDLTYIDDTIDAFITVMNSDVECDVFNVGTGHEISMNELVDVLNRILNKDVKAVYKENPISNYVQRTLADNEKIKRMLNWTPKYTLEDGIREILKNTENKVVD